MTTEGVLSQLIVRTISNAKFDMLTTSVVSDISIYVLTDQ